MNADQLSTEEHINARGWMRVHSGLKVTVPAIRARDVRITDIANSLARLARYNGHTEGFITVGGHSLMVCEAVIEMGRPDLALEALMHDAPEAYMGDLVRPLKHLEGFGEVFQAAEHEVMTVIAEVFGLQYPFDPIIHEADDKVLAFEMENLRDNPEHWDDIRIVQGNFLAEFDRLYYFSKRGTS